MQHLFNTHYFFSLRSYGKSNDLCPKVMNKCQNEQMSKLNEQTIQLFKIVNCEQHTRISVSV
jgi:hypothetical protein